MTGLYDSRYEHDGCGVGFTANIKGKADHGILRDALTMLSNLHHRGGSGAEKETGDGAGVLMQIPDSLYRAECAASGIILPAAGAYGVGMLFIPDEAGAVQDAQETAEAVIDASGFVTLGWRWVPVNEGVIGSTARACMPRIIQVFVEPTKPLADDLTFEKELYVLRRQLESRLPRMYAASFSHRTVVYKGMLTAGQLAGFYQDLADERAETALALVHSRFSTNTFPSWQRAHPNRLLAHNGEINTLRGNIHWMNAREAAFGNEPFGENLSHVLPVVDESGSDSSMFDNALEFLMASGYSLPHALVMMMPEPWQHSSTMDENLKAFYQYHSCLMEPWDGPASVVFTDGRLVGAMLDRNGLRPSRYYLTDDDRIIMASEVGVLPIAPEQVRCKGRLGPGRILLVDTELGRVVEDKELKGELAAKHPYGRWLQDNLRELPLRPPRLDVPLDTAAAEETHRVFGYTYEEMRMLLAPMAQDGVEPLGAMGIDTPLAVLSDRPQLLFNYFKQLFAQVTNPPIDALREEIVTSTQLTLGREFDLLQPGPENCRQIAIESPILSDADLAALEAMIGQDKVRRLSAVFPAADGAQAMSRALDDLFVQAADAVESGVEVLILSDKMVDSKHAPIPALLAGAGLHHELIRRKLRTRVGLVVESGEVREVHHAALLLGYGVTGIHPYAAVDAVRHLVTAGHITDRTETEAIQNYRRALTKGIVKIMSKMGISTLQSYRGAQIFEAIGIGQDVVDTFFSGTASRIGGIGLDIIAEETLARHRAAYEASARQETGLSSGGDYQWRKGGEHHMYNPESIYKLQTACRTNDYGLYKEFAAAVQGDAQPLTTLRRLFAFTTQRPAVPLAEVESVDSIVKRFKSGAMSYGSLSPEAHETLAIAMNRLGGKSNSGEGGEDPERCVVDAAGDLRASAIRQVASGRFGVTSEYLTQAKELQIKIAQGAKPGEGGQLPGRKVYPWIAKTRHSTPGVGLISPPPHHDIYSIEDLAQLIHDLKNANKEARVSVKLVSAVGVGTIAAGVAKGRADVVLISGYDGGTGASPRSSIRHTGLPWELGLADTHQTLLLNDLRSRIVVETDGKLLTGRDVAIACLLGAEEFGFATAPLIALGCVMLRMCHMDTCAVGVATQNPELRKNFRGKPEYVVNLLRFIAQDLRETMAALGFRSIAEMVGHTECLAQRPVQHWKASCLDLSPMLAQPRQNTGPLGCTESQDHQLNQSLDATKLLGLCEPALVSGAAVSGILPIANTHRVVGTMLGSEITRRHGADGLPEDTVKLRFRGSAGQSMGAFIPRGLTMVLEGDANDYFGKGLSGGKLIVFPPKQSPFVPETNVLLGNVSFYGATSGEAYVRGVAGERFCVRNSGMEAVVEGVGDHGCEYMTGGRVVVLGPFGANFAAGMSGGIAYLLREEQDIGLRVNQSMVGLEELDSEDQQAVYRLVHNHWKYTGSAKAAQVLHQWPQGASRFVKVIPNDYKRMLEASRQLQAQGLDDQEAAMAAFTKNSQDLARVGGS